MKFLVLSSLATLLVPAAGSCGVGCLDLSQTLGAQLPEGVEVTATPIAAWSLSIPNGLTNITGNKFALCRVTGTIAYGDNGNDTLNFELWLPDKSTYNGRYVAVGKSTLAKERLDTIAYYCIVWRQWWLCWVH